MTAENRRSTDHEIERIWGAIDRLAGQLGEVATGLATHSAVCTRDQETRESDRKAMRAALDRLVTAADRRDWTVKLVRWAWGVVGAAVTAAAAFWEHVGPAVLRWFGKGAVVAVLLAGAAMAHDGDTARDRYLGSLIDPRTGGSCCDMRDCSETDDWRGGAAGYEVKVDGAWIPVPPDVVIRDRPHPDGRAVLCYRGGEVRCFVEGMGA